MNPEEKSSRAPGILTVEIFSLTTGVPSENYFSEQPRAIGKEA
jgi:hypothetical protein